MHFGSGSEGRAIMGLVFRALSVRFLERGREWRQIEE